ncbi:GSCOCG00012660001-RA-CDS, partial [Cotesia congregata]
MPKEIRDKSAVLNIQNNDMYCFLWCVKAALFPTSNRHPERVSSYPDLDNKFNIKGIKFPMKLHDIPKFEKLNNLRINVYENSVVVPLHLSNNLSDRKTIHLLMVESGRYFQTIFHFALIRNLSRLIKSQISKGHSKLWFCDRCLCHFKYERSLKKHLDDCIKFNNVRMRLPEKDEDKILSFKNYKYKDPVPFIIYADFECIL